MVETVVNFDTMIWATLIVVIIVLFREQLRSFVTRLWRIKIPGGELEAERRQEELPSRQEVDDLLAERESFWERTLAAYEEEFDDSIFAAQLEIDQLRDELLMVEIQLDFERIYNLIFGSQLRLLESLALSDVGITQDELTVYFYRVQNLYSSFQGWGWQDYLRFLEVKKLIEAKEDKKYHITEFGQQFLVYVSVLGYSKEKAF